MLILNDTKEAKTIIKTINNLFDTLKIKLKPENLTISLLNREHTVFCDLEAKPDYFNQYSIQEECELYLDTGELNKALQNIKVKDTVKIELDGANIMITGVGSEHKNIFTLPLIDEDYTTPRLPDLDLTYSTTLDTDEFKDLIKLMKEYGEQVIFTTGDYQLILTSNNEFHQVESVLDTLTPCNETYVSKFSISYLMNLSQLKLGDEFQLELGSDMPCRLNYTNFDETCKISFLMAPRIDGD